MRAHWDKHTCVSLAEQSLTARHAGPEEKAVTTLGKSAWDIQAYLREPGKAIPHCTLRKPREESSDCPEILIKLHSPKLRKEQRLSSKNELLQCRNYLLVDNRHDKIVEI